MVGFFSYVGFTIKLSFYNKEDDLRAKPKPTPAQAKVFDLQEAELFLKICGDFFLDELSEIIGEDKTIRPGAESIVLEYMANDYFDTRHMYQVFELLKVFNYKFEEDFYAIKVDSKNPKEKLIKTLKAYAKICNNQELPTAQKILTPSYKVTYQKEEPKEDPDFIKRLDTFATQLDNFTDLNMLYSCAKYFHLRPIEHLCRLSFASLVYFRNIGEMGGVMTRLGISGNILNEGNEWNRIIGDVRKSK